jgi:hypothetical protein
MTREQSRSFGPMAEVILRPIAGFHFPETRQWQIFSAASTNDSKFQKV